MLVAIGADSFDTTITGCTTHFTSILAIMLSREGYELVDYPWLVRLNPAVPWKTRGNGATALIVRVDTKSEAEHVSEIAHKAAREYSSLSPPFQHKEALVTLIIENANDLQGFLSTRSECLIELYRRAVSTIVPYKLALDCLRKIKEQGSLLLAYGEGNRGLLGALAALGVDFSKDFTFEILAYRKPEMLTKTRIVDEASVISFDLRYRPLTFMNYDYETGKLLITPHGIDPVFYGVRGESPEVVSKAPTEIRVGEKLSHWVIFRTNQATNAHLRRATNIDRIHPYDNVIVEGKLVNVKRIPGGHVIGLLCNGGRCISVAFYRETARLRTVAMELEGSIVEVGGQVKPHTDRYTLNAEYIRVPCTGETYYPPLAAYHHLMRPPERPTYRQPRQLEPPKTRAFSLES